MRQPLAKWKKLIGRMVCITWTDSSGQGGWDDRDEDCCNVVECISVGQLRSINDTDVNLHGTWTRDQVMHQTAIPVAVIHEIVELVRI